MHTRYDRLGKEMLRAGLQGRGTFTAELDVSPDPQRVDGYFVPNLELATPVANTLLGRMTRRSCSFEMFSEAPARLDLSECARKHLNLLHGLRKETPADGLPHQWVLSAGKPFGALDAARAIAAPNWPRGFHALPELLETTVVVLNELAEERATLFLRLMGRGRTLKRAIAELKTLSEGEFERHVALPLLIRYRFEVAQAPVSPADEEFLMTSQEAMALYEQRVELRGEQRGELRGEQRGELRGELRGLLQGQRTTVLRMLRRKFGELPEKIVARIQAAETEALEQFEDKLLFAKTLDEVFASQGSDGEGRSNV
jgi:hypothetical protein